MTIILKALQFDQSIRPFCMGLIWTKNNRDLSLWLKVAVLDDARSLVWKTSTLKASPEIISCVLKPPFILPIHSFQRLLPGNRSQCGVEVRVLD